MNAPNRATIAPTITVRSRAWMNAELAAAVIRLATSAGSSAAANDAAPTESFTAVGELPAMLPARWRSRDHR